MRIKIVKYISDDNIEFSASIGSGVGFWSIDSFEEGKEYHIEFEIGPIIKLGLNAEPASDKSCFIRHHLDTNEIQGMVDGIDEDGLFYLRLADDCLIMVENEITGLNVGDYLLLTLKADELRVYPTGYRNLKSPPIA